MAPDTKEKDMSSFTSDAPKADEVEAQPIKGRYACPLDGCKTTGETVAGIRHHITTVHKLPGRDYEVEPRSNMTYGATVYGPNGEKVRLLFYANGSLRIRVNEAGPMAISEAFLPGKGENVIVKLIPA